MGRFEHPIKDLSFCATSKVNYSLYLTYRTFYHVHLSKVKSTPLRTPIFARPIFTDRTGRLTKLFHISH
nr:MAG TPA: hypothetical protein [Caudoviricetes sp.]